MDRTKVVCPSPPIMVTKVGYTPILTGDDYGARMLDVDNAPSLFETLKDCEDIYKVGEDGCVAIAKVTWEEAA